jgi:lysophospholipid acyltransferase
VSANARHLFALVPGLIACIVLYGADVLHPVAMVLYSYALLRWLPPHVAPHAICFVAMAHQTAGHVQRMYTDYLSYTLDWTLSTMLITFKLCDAAWAVRDGAVSADAAARRLTPGQMHAAVSRRPTLLELAAFAFNFQGFATGPWPEFRHYLEFAERRGPFHSPHSPPSVDPFVSRAATGRVLATGLAGAAILVSSACPEARLLDAEFASQPLWRRLLYMVISVELGSFKYFFTWWLGELACVLSGLAYNGRDKATGADRWDACLQVDLLAFKRCTDAKGLTTYWSMSPQRFLKRGVFQRLCGVVSKPTATQLTFVFSAFWHGLYPGYFLFFSCGALFGSVISVLKARLKPFVYCTEEEDADSGSGGGGKGGAGVPIAKWRHWLFTALFWTATHFVLAYAIVPFRVMSWSRSIRAWSSVAYSGHLVIGAFFVASLLLPPVKIRSG